jgi:HK97 family phage major capsid protein
MSSSTFKNHQDDEASYAKQQWEILCAKNGLPEAGSLKASGHNMNNGEAHNARKTMRRAVNQITAKMNIGDYDNEASAGLTHAGKIIAELSTGIDYLERGKDAPTGGMDVMRNQADFQKHYNATRGDEAEFGISDFLKGVAGLRTNGAVQNALSMGTDTAGGYTVPSILMPGILGALVPVSSVLTAGAGIMALEQGGKNYTIAGVDTIPTAAWRAESGALAVSDPAFRAVLVKPQSLAFTFKISRELLADGEGIEQALLQAIAQSFARELDRAALRGSGTAPEPRGLLNLAGVQSVANGTNGAVLGGYSNLFAATQAILEANAPMPTAAIMSVRSLVKLGGLIDSTGQPLRRPDMLTSMQMIGTSQIPNNLTVGSSSDCSEIYVGDFTQMMLAFRENVSIQLLRELYAATGEIGFAAHVRADVVARYPGAFAKVTGVR